MAHVFTLLQRKTLLTPQACFSTTSSFFSYNAGRARRKRRLRRQKVEREKRRAWRIFTGEAAKSEAEGIKDTRTVQDILWPNPFKNVNEPNADDFRWPRDWATWKQTFKVTWLNYKYTWDGYFTSEGFFVDCPEEAERKRLEQIAIIEGRKLEVMKNEDHLASFEGKKEAVMKNVEANADFVAVEAQKLRQEIRNRTGIHSKDDLRNWAAGMMKLATECISEFMKGYRKGRDDEVENMLTKYFQQLEEEANKPRKRIAKRRILNRFHPGVVRKIKFCSKKQKPTRKQLAAIEATDPSTATVRNEL